LTDIKRIVLDVLKPHNPSIVELSRRLAGLHGVTGVNCTVDEVDQETESLKITVEGTSVDYGKVEASTGSRALTARWTRWTRRRRV